MKKIFNLKKACPASSRQTQRGGGFTLVEMLVAVGLFALIASFALGAVLSIFDANRKARSSKTVVDNLNLSIENMQRTVRFGGNYHCGSSGSLFSPQNCPNGDSLLAVTFKNNLIVYKFCSDSKSIRRSDITGETNCNNMTQITSSDTVIEYVRFKVFGSEVSNNNEQPYILAVIKGYVGTRPTSQSSFSIQTLMSQRKLDI